jgi:SAM-dependent methyltransferase
MARVWHERMELDGVVATHDEYEHVERYRWAAGRISGRVLDIACGTGHGTAVLAAAGAAVTGADSDPGAIDRARRRAPSARLALVEAPPVPFDDGAFDHVVSFETLEHIRRDAEFLAELHRVLAPGGRLLLSTPNRAASSPNTARPDNPYHVREYLLDELLTLLETAGFEQPLIHCQRPERRRLPEYAAMAVISRVPRLCQPGRWWDDLAHGSGRVTPWTPAITHPLSWVIEARRSRAAAPASVDTAPRSDPPSRSR